MKIKEFLNEYKTRDEIRNHLLLLKEQAIAEVKQIDDEYWSDKPIELRQKYEKMNKLPKDHPIYVEVQRDIEKIRNGERII